MIFNNQISPRPVRCFLSGLICCTFFRSRKFCGTPFVELPFGKQKGHRIPDEVQDAGAIESYAEKGIDCRQHQGDKDAGLGERQDREQKSHADDTHVPEFPEPQGCFGGQVIGIDVQIDSPPREKPPGFPGGQFSGLYFGCRLGRALCLVLSQCLFDESDDELLLADFLAPFLFSDDEVLQPLIQFLGDLKGQGFGCCHGDVTSFKVLGENHFYTFGQGSQCKLLFLCHDLGVQLGGNHGSEIFLISHGTYSFL